MHRQTERRSTEASKASKEDHEGRHVISLLPLLPSVQCSFFYRASVPLCEIKCEIKCECEFVGFACGPSSTIRSRSESGPRELLTATSDVRRPQKGAPLWRQCYLLPGVSDLHAMLQWKYSLHFLIQQPFKQKLYMFKTEQAATLVLRKALKTEWFLLALRFGRKHLYISLFFSWQYLSDAYNRHNLVLTMWGK